MARILKTVRVSGPAGTILVNETDLEQFRSQGYELCGPTTSDAAPQPPVETPAEVPLDKLTVEELRDKAAGLGVINAAKLQGADLIDTITRMTAVETRD